MCAGINTAVNKMFSPANPCIPYKMKPQLTELHPCYQEFVKSAHETLRLLRDLGRLAQAMDGQQGDLVQKVKLFGNGADRLDRVEGEQLSNHLCDSNHVFGVIRLQAFVRRTRRHAMSE